MDDGIIFRMYQELIPVHSFKEWKGPRLRNVVAVLLLEGTQNLFLVTERNGKKGPLAGKVERYDKSLWNALEREFLEETGYYLPDLSRIRKFIYHGHTAIYLACVKNLPLGLPKGDNEILWMELVSLDILYTKEYKKTLRHSAIKSLSLIKPYLLSNLANIYY